jgi:hypothetical protein
MPQSRQAYRFLKILRRRRSDPSFAKDSGVAESTLDRLINGDQSATLGAARAFIAP